MNLARLSSETIHATTVASGGRAVLLLGPSGSGKSDIALQLIDRGFALVSDDQTILRRDGERLRATAPATIRGKIEIRGLGIIDMPCEDDVAVSLAVALTSEFDRLPDEGNSRQYLGVAIPMMMTDSRAASAAAKVVLALDRLGLKW